MLRHSNICQTLIIVSGLGAYLDLALSLQIAILWWLLGADQDPQTVSSKQEIRKVDGATNIVLFSDPIMYCDVSYFDLTTRVWTAGSPLTTCRYRQTCNLVTSPSGEREIVVVGGRNDLLSCDRLDEVEIINIDTNTTRNGESINDKSKERKLT